MGIRQVVLEPRGEADPDPRNAVDRQDATERYDDGLAGDGRRHRDAIDRDRSKVQVPELRGDRVQLDAVDLRARGVRDDCRGVDPDRTARPIELEVRSIHGVERQAGAPNRTRNDLTGTRR